MKFKITGDAPKRRLPIAPPGIRHTSEKTYDRKKEVKDYKDIHLKIKRCEDCGNEIKEVDDQDCPECSGREWVRESKKLIHDFIDVYVKLKVLRNSSYNPIKKRDKELDAWMIKNRLKALLVGVRL